MSKRTCSIEGCEVPGRLKRGYCSKHYQRLMKHGTPTGGNRNYSTPEQAIQGRSEWRGDCRIWTGHLNHKGYPRFNVSGRWWLVYRYIWVNAHGEIPEGMQVNHKCFNRSCINIAHLELVTRAQNAQYRSGAQPNSESGLRNVVRAQSGWRVVVQKGRKQHYFGAYDTIEEAAAVAEQARKKLFGEFAGRG